MQRYNGYKINFFKELNRERRILTRKLKNKIFLSWYYFRYLRKTNRVDNEGIKNCKTITFLVLNAGIGDCIVLSGLISELRKSGKYIYCVCTPKTIEIFKSLIKTDGVYAIRSIDESYKEIKKQCWKTDIIVDYNDPDKNLYKRVRILLGIDHRYSLGVNQKDKRFYDINLIRDEKGQHWSDRLIAIGRVLGINIINYNYALCFSAKTIYQVRTFINNVIKKQGIIIINPTASDKFRCLSDKTVEQLIYYLQHITSLKIVVYNLKNKKLEETFPDVIFNPFEDLESSLNLVEECSLLITTDTSYVHVGNFYKVPMIAIYNNRLNMGKYCNNVQWSPNYSNSIQVFSDDNVGTETGDDLRRMKLDLIMTDLSKKFVINALNKHN